ncbi:uncharacterized protein LOC144366599 [Ictidomys tridecemlineatus]
MEYVLFVLYFSFFLCLCALVCLYFSGCQEMTYKHEGKHLAAGEEGSLHDSPQLCPESPHVPGCSVGEDRRSRREGLDPVERLSIIGPFASPWPITSAKCEHLCAR